MAHTTLIESLVVAGEDVLVVLQLNVRQFNSKDLLRLRR